MRFASRSPCSLRLTPRLSSLFDLPWVSSVDVGQATAVATVLVGAANERPKKETRTFRTVTRELLEMREWVLTKRG